MEEKDNLAYTLQWLSIWGQSNTDVEVVENNDKWYW